MKVCNIAFLIAGMISLPPQGMHAQAGAPVRQGSPSQAVDELVSRFEREFSSAANLMPADK